MVLATAIISLLGTVAAIFLKFYPGWKKKVDTEKGREQDAEFDKALLNCDSADASRLLLERMRDKEEDGGTP